MLVQMKITLWKRFFQITFLAYRHLFQPPSQLFYESSVRDTNLFVYLNGMCNEVKYLYNFIVNLNIYNNYNNDSLANTVFFALQQ